MIFVLILSFFLYYRRYHSRSDRFLKDSIQPTFFFDTATIPYFFLQYHLLYILMKIKFFKLIYFTCFKCLTCLYADCSILT